MNYFSRVFQPTSLAQAKDIVLSPDSSNPTKFETETNFLVDFIVTNELIKPTDKVLDFGCGMGRVAKKLIDAIGCNVIGLDSSEHMLFHATTYVNNTEKFIPTTEYNINDIDAVIATFVLQHTETPAEEINKIFNVVKDNGIVVVVNELTRFVPVGVDRNGYVIWHDDGINIFDILAQKFTCVGTYDYPNTKQKPLSVWTKNIINKFNDKEKK